LSSGGAVKTKNPLLFGSGFLLKSFENESKPGCRAGKQRVRKQQVQINVHGVTLVHLFCFVTGKVVE
jgi:hypothetical protein